MIKQLLLIVSLTLLSIEANAQTKDAYQSDSIALSQWQAGQKIRKKSVERFGIDHCFCAERISKAVFRRMQGHSYKANCSIAVDELRYLRVLHYTKDGSIQMGELVCNQAIASDLLEIFRELFKAHYPIERIVLIDNYDADDARSMADNNTSCFNFRSVAGTTRLSNHSRGLAIDINPRYNPCVKRRKDGTTKVEPSNGRAYTDRSKTFDYKISHADLCYRLFIQHGFKWGGNWKSKKDYQHFEKSFR